MVGGGKILLEWQLRDAYIDRGYNEQREDWWGKKETKEMKEKVRQGDTFAATASLSAFRFCRDNVGR